MGRTLHQVSTDASRGDQETGLHHSPPAQPHLHKELDAGALFVLKSKGSWLHCGYHLTTSIVAPPLLSLPFALATLGWVAGLFSLTIVAVVTFYSYNLLSVVLEHHAHLGKRQLRFRDMASDILGAKWGKYFVGPLQSSLCYGAVIASILIGGQSLKFIYLLSTPKVAIKLYEFIIIFGVLVLILAQMPSFHSLRHINLVSLVLCLCYSACATAGSIYIGNSKKAPIRDYSLHGNAQNRMFHAFSGISIIATTYGNGIIPEIQATIAAPVKGKMFKGLCLCYVVAIATFFSVAISGYWAFGNEAAGTILNNFMVDEKPLLPRWFLMITNVFTLMQVSAVTLTYAVLHNGKKGDPSSLASYSFLVISEAISAGAYAGISAGPTVGKVYLQPMNEVLEKRFADPKEEQFSSRNVIPRLISRSLAVVIATTIAAMFPFFGDINAVLGAAGFIPLDFVLPMVFYNVTFFKSSKRNLIFWVNTLVLIVFSLVGVVGMIAAVRQIVIDAKIYRLFANV